MKHKTVITFLAVLLTSSVATAQTIDFSRAYLDKSKTGINSIQLNGVTAPGFQGVYGTVFQIDSSYNLKLAGVSAQSLTTVEQLQQSIRNTQWSGHYGADCNSPTDFQVISVQDGFVNGRMTHKAAFGFAAASWDGYVSGVIVVEYQVGSTWTASDALTLSQTTALTSDTPNRLRMRLKRVSAIEILSDSVIWYTNREYRLLKEGNSISGEVGNPADMFGSSSGLTSSCPLTLTLKN